MSQFEAKIRRDIKRGIPLPETFQVHEIIQLWTQDYDERKLYYDDILVAINRGELRIATDGREYSQVRPDANYFIWVKWVDDGKESNATIHKDDFKQWLDGNDEWPLKDCLLANWWADEKSKSAKPRKKLKPMLREANDALLLIYDLLRERKISYLGELSGVEAWGLIFPGEFTSNLIDELPRTAGGKLKFKSG